MLNDIQMRLIQVADLVRSSGWSSLLRELFFLGRTAIVVEKDLEELTERSEPLASAKLKVFEIDQAVLASGVYRFAVRNRYLKALNYLRRGYGGYALARDNVIVGDTWHYAPKAGDDPRMWHEDLRRFGFSDWKKTDVYTFDIFVAPDERKGGVSAAFQKSAMLALRSKGYTRAYGFYWSDNLPAQWCTRVTNKWKEKRAFRVSRLLIFKWAVLAHKDQADLKSQPSWLKNMLDKGKIHHGRTADQSESGF
jgi:GNAT superfamily N-acetyltransferase